MKKPVSPSSREVFRRIVSALASFALIFHCTFPAPAQTNLPAFMQVGTSTNGPTAPANLPAWITRPLTLADALNIALQQNGTILKAKNDLEATYGVVVQTRAIALPKLQSGTLEGPSEYTAKDQGLVEKIPGVTQPFPNQNWNVGVQVVQSVYEGGRMLSALRAAKLTKEQALFQYQSSVADVLLLTRVAYYDVLVAYQQIIVNEASVSLLTRELEDQQHRFEAGTVPRFNVLRAEVAVANARPGVIRARNDYRISKNLLSNLLGYNLPRDIWEDIPLQLTDKLEAEPYSIDLPAAIMQALEKRPELGALRKTEALQRENIINAKSGYQPSLQAFAGYEYRSSAFSTELGHQLNGWTVGGQLNWSIFDGMLTRGKVMQAKALHEKSKTDLDDTARRIELDVRTAYSTFIEAKEVLESQLKVQEQAEEALRLAKARADAGTGTQLDVLDAENSLTQARTTQVQALHDYAVARARLLRATGQDIVEAGGKWLESAGARP
jgi:outer membrane protein TolC